MLKAVSQLFQKKSNPKEFSDYISWRDRIFDVTSAQADVLTKQPNQVYGVIMDVGLSNDFIITITAFATGESSLMTTVGGGVIGLGSNEYIAEHAKHIVALGQSLIEVTHLTNNHNLPKSNKVFFYFLTTSGLTVSETSVDEADNQTHPFHEMFAKFTEIKRRSEEIRKNSEH